MAGMKYGDNDGDISNPSFKKMKEDIAMKEIKNQELQDQIKRLKKNLGAKGGESDMVKGLMKELEIQADLMKTRDAEIQDLLNERAEFEKKQLEHKKEAESQNA